MATKIKSEDRWYDILKVFIEIVALSAATYLGFINFKLKDEPSLQNSSRLTSDLTVDTVNGKMHLSYFASVENHGKSVFEVNEPEVTKVWIIPFETLTKKTNFDWVDYMKNNRPTDSALSGSYISSYAPDQLIKNSSDFFFEKPKRSAVLVGAFFRFSSSRLFHRDVLWQDTTYDAKLNIDSNLWVTAKKGKGKR